MSARSRSPAARFMPWLDRTGRLSVVKLVAFVGVFGPIAWIAWQAAQGELGPKPVMETIHQSGDWAVRLLLISLAVTPLRHVVFTNSLILTRRILGVAVLAYAAFHLGLYTLDQKFVWWTVAREIALRFYLTIGFVALLGLAVLGVTSTDGMIRRLGALRWNRLHLLVWPIAVLALLHFYIQTKLDVTEPVLMSGLFFLLVGVRALVFFGFRVEPVGLAVVALASGLVTALCEYVWYATMTGVPALRVLESNLDFAYVIRPAWWVLATGLGLAALNLVLRLFGRREPQRRARDRRSSSPERAAEAA